MKSFIFVLIFATGMFASDLSRFDKAPIGPALKYLIDHQAITDAERANLIEQIKTSKDTLRSFVFQNNRLMLSSDQPIAYWPISYAEFVDFESQLDLPILVELDGAPIEMLFPFRKNLDIYAKTKGLHSVCVKDGTLTLSTKAALPFWPLNEPIKPQRYTTTPMTPELLNGLKPHERVISTFTQFTSDMDQERVRLGKNSYRTDYIGTITTTVFVLIEDTLATERITLLQDRQRIALDKLLPHIEDELRQRTVETPTLK